MKSKSPPSSPAVTQNEVKITGFGGGVYSFHDNKLARAVFLPQISIYNRILRKAEKGGGENTS